MTASKPTPIFLTVSQIAERWKCSEKTVRRTIERGDLVAHRFNGMLRITQDDLRAYERSCRDD